MITVLKKDQGLIVKGHANQAKYGQDIVCASVSTALIMTINQIEIFSKLDKINYNISEGYFEIEYQNDDIVLNIIKNLEFTLENLKQQYPKNIK